LARYRLGVDIGGTFTDFVLFDAETGQYRISKNLTTPKDLSIGVMQGVERLVDDLSQVESFVHGTTAGINAFLERRGAHCALVTTEGFKDVYSIARTNRREMYNLFYKKPTPLIRRRDTFTVRERTRYDGTIIREVAKEDLLPLIERLRDGQLNSVAVCLLHSYANPANELKAREIIKAHAPDVSVSLSHETANEWREYERTSTVAINAYVAPIIQQYLEVLEGKMRDRGFAGHMYIMQSNGGVMKVASAKAMPLQTLFSGPVGGTVGCVALGERRGEHNLLCVDMGGTSFDVSLIVDGRPDVTSETELEGFPVLMSIVNIYSIGAGGGSIAWREGGGLRVGPKSAGSDPGPACYGKGGGEPTVTDANVYLGRVDPRNFLGGDMQLDMAAADRALTGLAADLGMDAGSLAEGVLDIVNAKMANAIREITVRKGIDPRDFTMVAFGGAGPMHAVFLAEELDINRVLVPKAPGTFSAWGMLQTDIRHDLTRTFVRTFDALDVEELEGLYAAMEEEGRGILAAEGVAVGDMRFLRSADMRYYGQEYVVGVRLPEGPYDREAVSRLSSLFHRAHQARYGHHNPTETVELVTLRLAAVGEIGRQAERPSSRRSGELPPSATRSVVFRGRPTATHIYQRDNLKPGHAFPGPAVVEEKSCTTVVPPGFSCRVDEYGNILITRSREEA